MFGIGMPEMILILAIALIVLGPKKLPDLAKSLGKGINEFRKATQDFKSSIDMDDDIKKVKDVKETFDEFKSDINDTIHNPVKKVLEAPASESNKSQNNDKSDDGKNLESYDKISEYVDVTELDKKEVDYVSEIKSENAKSLKS